MLCFCFVLEIWVEIVFNWLTFGLDFTIDLQRHVILLVFKCFPENWPKRLSLEVLNAWFELGRKIWIFQILASTLERRIPHSREPLFN